MNNLNFFEQFEKMESYLPFKLVSIADYTLVLFFIFAIVSTRYFIFCFLAEFIFLKDIFTKTEKLHDFKLKHNQIFHEIKWSMASTLIFSISGLILALLWQNSLTQIYLKLDQFSIWYLPLSFIIYSLAHDAYYYLTHRWMHQPKIYKRIHAIHHYSKKVSPWASLSFHPTEAVIQALFLPIMMCLVPIHPLTVIVYLIFMTLTAISNHLGVEIFSAKWITKWFISGEHHAIHHDKFTVNYGLYYRFMDIFFETESK